MADPVQVLKPHAGTETEFRRFVHACSVLTGFEPFDLYGTGLVRAYHDLLARMAGPAAVEALETRLHDLPREHEARDHAIRSTVLADEWLGPVARSLIKLWYLGTWIALPADWHTQYGGDSQDTTFIPSPQAYIEGLVWPAIGAHPMGAKPDGFGAWASPPKPID